MFVVQPITHVDKERLLLQRRRGHQRVGFTRRFGDFIQIVGPGSVNEAVLAGRPSHLDIELAGFARGKHAHRLVAGQVTPAANNLLLLGHWSASNFDLGTNAGGILSMVPFEPNGNTWRNAVIAVNPGRAVEVVNYQVEVAVVV